MVGSFCTRSHEISHSHRLKANRIRARIDSPLYLLSPSPDGFNHLTDGINYELRLLLMYFVTAIRVDNVLFIRHKLGEPFLCFFLRGIDDIAQLVEQLIWNSSLTNGAAFHCFAYRC